MYYILFIFMESAATAATALVVAALFSPLFLFFFCLVNHLLVLCILYIHEICVSPAILYSHSVQNVRFGFHSTSIVAIIFFFYMQQSNQAKPKIIQIKKYELKSRTYV